MYVNVELIVVNDGSTDDSDAVIGKLNKKCNFTYVYQDNAGVSAAYNKGLFTRSSGCPLPGSLFGLEI